MVFALHKIFLKDEYYSIKLKNKTVYYFLFYVFFSFLTKWLLTSLANNYIIKTSFTHKNNAKEWVGIYERRYDYNR